MSESLLFYRHWGEGEPLVMLHGLFGSIENLGMVSRQLKDDFSVYAVDLPNHGRSPHTQSLSLGLMADRLIRWMDQQSLAQVHFLGHSLGGKVAMEVALRYPERVRQLLVVDIAPVAYPRRHDAIFSAFDAVDLGAIRQRQHADAAMQAHVPEAAVRSFLLKNLEQSQGRWQWRMNLPVLRDDYEQLIAANSADCAAFTRPVLFVKGERSSYIVAAYQQAILQRFPQAQVRVITNTEHWLHAEKPALFASIARRFFSNM
ncbi:MAG: alpha/beta fold hydrolase [Cellvibrionaceae bacterium]|nr:alpha/beta fold hydrolase [Cellvibrionaceae bacterium]